MEKEAQTFVADNPIIVAKQIKGIIDVMIGRMSPESQVNAYPNLKEKLNNLNISEISNKRAPGGASIGLSISLVKNILNGRDPMFAHAVLSELTKIL